MILERTRSLALRRRTLPNVDVCINVPGNCVMRNVTANGLGAWTAIYSPDYDLQPGDNGWAAEYDLDLDQTWYDWNIPSPHVQVRANENRVEGQQWSLASVVNIDVSRAGESIAGIETVGTAPWDPNQTYFEHNFASLDIQVGDLVSVTDGSITRTTTVTNLAFTNINLADDIVTGVATPNANVDIWICDGSACDYNRHVTANGTTGIWVANFDIVGSQPDEQTIVDIVPGT